MLNLNPSKCLFILLLLHLHICVCAGLTMYAVGVGKAVEDELSEIASDPVEKYFYYTTDFSAINTIAENLKLNVCPGQQRTADGLIDYSRLEWTRVQ